MTDRRLKLTLLADGTSDSALLPIVKWLWDDLRPNNLDEFTFADPRRIFPLIDSNKLDARIFAAMDHFPCDILFVHRDGEKESPEIREQQILHAFNRLRDTKRTTLPHPPVCVVPVRMSEAWMFSDEMAIRKAAGNPNGRIFLNLPPAQKVEALPDPKGLLYETLVKASELPRRRRFDPVRAVARVTELTRSFELLRRLSAFQRFENNVRRLLAMLDKG